MKKNKKEILIYILKIIIELAVFILLILWIMRLLNKETGIFSKINEGEAGEKLDTAIKVFSSTDGMKLEDAIRSIEGLEDLQINKETGEYNIKIDGQYFIVISQEIIPEEEMANEVKNNGKED